MINILYIDDEVVMSRSLACELESDYNLKIDLTDNYDNINSLLEKGYDAIILDIMMPIDSSIFNEKEIKEAENGKRTGLILFRKIREIMPTLPIILYTSQKSLTIDIDEYSVFLRKPELTEVLSDTIMRLVKMGRD